MSHSHGHHHHDHGSLSDRGLALATILNLVLTVIELIAGLISGSVALISDAVHNGSDAGSLVIAWIARRWSRRQPDTQRTFGYRRAAVIGAMLNVTILLVIAIALIAEGIQRIWTPRDVDAWLMIIVAGIAAVIDVATVLLMARMGRDVNIRAALVHNLSDAFASFAVIIAGIGILLWDLYWLDPALTILIALYILLQGVALLRRCIAILMDSVPSSLDPQQIADTVLAVDGIHAMHHLHVRELDEHFRVLEAHIVVDDAPADVLEQRKLAVKQRLHEAFAIEHSTLEMEFTDIDSDDSRRLIAQGH